MSVSFRPLNKALDAIFNYQTVTQENLSSGFANNEGADETAHPHSLISAFVICYLGHSSQACFMHNFTFLATFEAEETGLGLPLLETPKTGIIASRSFFNVSY